MTLLLTCATWVVYILLVLRTHFRTASREIDARRVVQASAPQDEACEYSRDVQTDESGQGYPSWDIVVVVLLVAAITGVVLLKRADQIGKPPRPGNGAASVAATPAPQTAEPAQPVSAPQATASGPVTVQGKALPRLVDLGSDSCIPCKMMAPILDDLKKQYAGRLSVEFYDVRKNSADGDRYGIKLIPTQIFFDASGKELFRHEGFLSKEDILAKWKELGVDFAPATK